MSNNQKLSKTWWDEEKQIIRHQADEPYTEADAEDFIKTIAETKKKFPDKNLELLIDLKKARAITTKARSMIAEGIYKDSDLGKIACFGMGTFARVVNSFMVKASGIKDDKLAMFAAEEEALRWLKQENNKAIKQNNNKAIK